MSQKRIRKWFAGISLSIILIITGTIALLLLEPSLFIRDIEQKASALFPEESGLKISIESFSGNFLRGFHFKEIELHKGATFVGYVGDCTADISLKDLILQKFYFNKITLLDCGFDLDTLLSTDFGGYKRNNPESRLAFAINHLKISRSSIHYHGTDFRLNLSGNLTTAYGLSLNIDTADLQTERLKDMLILDGTQVKLISNVIEINPLNFNTRYAGKLFTTQSHLQITKTGFGKMDLEFGGDTKYGAFSIKNMNGLGHFADNIFSIDTSYCEYETGSLKSSGWIDLGTRAWSVLSNIDSVTVATDSLYTNFGGEVNLTGQNLLQSIHAAIDLKDIVFNRLRFNAVSGNLSYQDGKLSNIGDLNFISNKYSGIISHLDLTSSQDINIKGKIQVQDIALNEFMQLVPGVTATGQGEFNYLRAGELEKLQALVKADSISYGELTTGKMICDIDYTLPSLNKAIANVSGVIEDLNLVNKKFDRVLFIISAIDGTINLKKIEGHNSEGDLLSFSGRISDTLRVVNVDSLYGNLNGLDFNTDQFTIRKNMNLYTLGNTTLNIGAGSIGLSGEYKNLTTYQFNADVNNLDIQLMNDFFSFNQLFQGTANGNFQFSRSGNQPRFFSNIDIKNGKLDNLDFDKLAGQFSLRNNRLLISDLVLDSNDGQLSMAGIISLDPAPDRNFLSADDSLGILCKLNDFNLDTFHRYFRWGRKTRGVINGDLSISGSPASPKMLGNFSLSQPVFDRIKGDSITGTFVYEDQKAYFKSVKATLENGYYSVTGYLPVNFDFITKDRENAKNNPMDLMITGNAKAIDFLQPYIESIDSLTGNFAMQLSLTGTIAKPVRNGQIVLSDGRISVLNLDNSFTNLDGFATIDNNQLSIKYLNGMSRGAVDDSSLWESVKGVLLRLFSANQKPNPNDQPNIRIEGDMDMSYFFRPDYHLTLSGNDLFLKSSENKFIGIGDADITISGRDTVMVVGQFVPKPNEFMITDNFDSENTLKIKGYHTGPVLGYDIHVPLDNVIRMENSFLQGFEMDGDITITSLDEDDFRFSGTINIIDGTFILNGTEYTNTTGVIFLDPSSSVPSVDVEATTSVNGNEYRIFFKGDLNDPSYEIRNEKSGNFITADEQDAILRLLITGGTGSNGYAIGETGKSLFSNYLESEFEQFVSQHSPIDRFQVESDSALLTDFNKADVNISIEKNITHNLYMSIRSDVFSNQITNEYEVGYRINHNMSLVGRLDQNGLPHMNYRIKINY